MYGNTALVLVVLIPNINFVEAVVNKLILTRGLSVIEGST